MANIPLKSIKFPDLADAYTVPSNAGELPYNKSATYPADTVGKALQDKPDADGVYPDMTVGNAEQLVSNVFVEDKAPYQFRTAGGSVDIGKRAYFDAIVGGTVAWNQLVQNGNFANGTTGWGAQNGASITASNNVATISTVTGYVNQSIYSYTKDHIFIAWADFKGAENIEYRFNSVLDNIVGNGAWGRHSKILKSTASNNTVYLVIQQADGFDRSASYYIKNVNIVDLTLLLGSTIADYIYSLEQATAGAGVAFFRKYFPNSYYPYNAGELVSVSGLSAHKTNGFNQFDKDTVKTSEGAYILNDNGVKVSDGSSSYFTEATKVLPNTSYYVLANGDNVDGLQKLYYFDADDNFISRTGYISSGVYITPSNCHYIRYQYKVATVDTSKWCINLSWDGSRDGEYEEYKEHTYLLDDSLTLRGIPKLDASNKLYFDGDTYEPDGTVNRRYEERAYQVGDESLADAITDGTKTVVKKVTPTTDTAEPYNGIQIVDDFGTEEFVTTAIIPVGHVTHYPIDALAKLEMMPNSPSGNGEYIVTQSGGINEYTTLASSSIIENIINRLETLENA